MYELWTALLIGMILHANAKRRIDHETAAVIVGAAIDLSIALMPEPTGLGWRAIMLISGLVSIGAGSGLYLGTKLGPGSRDGLMTGIARRGISVRLTRTLLDSAVLVVGALLGGTFGIGTVAFALFMGPLVHFFLERFRVDSE